MSRMRLEKGKWSLWKNDELLGSYDVVVLAHNGKCATRLLAPAGLHLLARQMSRMKLSSIWALMLGFDQPLSAPFEVRTPLVAGRALPKPPSRVRRVV